MILMRVWRLLRVMLLLALGLPIGLRLQLLWPLRVLRRQLRLSLLVLSLQLIILLCAS